MEKNIVKIGDKHAGGIVIKVDESGEHGLVAAVDDVLSREKYHWHLRWEYCQHEFAGFTDSGFTDWRMPTLKEMGLVYKYVHLFEGLQMNGFDKYCTSDVDKTRTNQADVGCHYPFPNYCNAYCLDLATGMTHSSYKQLTHHIRPVRKF